MAQLGSAPALGAGGRMFKSSHPDKKWTKFLLAILYFTPYSFYGYMDDKSMIKSTSGKMAATTEKTSKLIKPKIEQVFKIGQPLPVLSLRVDYSSVMPVQSFWPGYSMPPIPGPETDLQFLAALCQDNMMQIISSITSSSLAPKHSIWGTKWGTVRTPFAMVDNTTLGKPELFEGFTPPSSYYPASNRRFHRLREHFSIKSTRELKKLQTLPPLSKHQRLEIVYYIACNYWKLIDNDADMQKHLHVRYFNRHDYHNIAAYIITDASKSKSTWNHSLKQNITKVYIDAIPIPQESYFELMTDIEEIFRLMGKPFSPAFGYLRAKEAQKKS